MAHTTFRPRAAYGEAPRYGLLPFRFARRNDDSYLLTNEVGEFCVVEGDTLRSLTQHRLSHSHPAYQDLKSRHFLSDEDSSALLDVLASKYRTKKSFLEGFTKLHIFVTSLRCNQSCPYCQVSRQGEEADRGRFDMSQEVLRKSVELMLSTPAPRITMEFQGGEPLVNFDLVREAVRLAEEQSQRAGKTIDYVLCTNLSLLEDAHLDFCKQHSVLISTSLDGPAELHDKNRPLGRGLPSHAIVTRNIARAQEALGKQAVSALMTTTRHSLAHAEAIVDEYLRMDLGSMFVRELNPFGFAVRTAREVGYGTPEFVRFYKEVLSYIIEVNRAGRTFTEAYATMVLRKILTPWPIGFVDLQSPAGAGIGVVLYNYDGNVYASDESRMLAETGDQTFRLGHVLEDTYQDIFLGETMQAIAAASCSESLAGCSDCVYQPYCGADPVRHYRTQGDLFGNRATSSHCGKHMSLISHLFDLLLGGDPDVERIFWAWINEDDVNRIWPHN
jgi:His-Xaa-Ser system radical SAM maturase HxsB